MPTRTLADRRIYLQEEPPREFYCEQMQLTRKQWKELGRLLSINAGERELDQFFQMNPAVFTAALNFHSTGHHGAWVLPQQTIRTRLTGTRPGLIPDYIIGGSSSDGFSWYVVEIKGANAKLFAGNGKTLRFSDTLNRGICQLLTYIDYCSEIQSHLRDQFKLTNFREPRGILVIGRRGELEDDLGRQKLKAAWNRVSNGRIDIRTYDSLLSKVDRMYSFHRATEVELVEAPLVDQDEVLWDDEEFDE